MSPSTLKQQGTNRVMFGGVWRIYNTFSEGFKLHRLGEWITTIHLPSVSIRERCDNHYSILIIFSRFTFSNNFFPLRHLLCIWVQRSDIFYWSPFVVFGLFRWCSGLFSYFGLCIKKKDYISINLGSCSNV